MNTTLETKTNSTVTMGSYVVADKLGEKIGVVSKIDVKEQKADVVYLELNEHSDDVVARTIQIPISDLAEVDDSFINLRGQLCFIQSCIMTGQDITCFSY